MEVSYLEPDMGNWWYVDLGSGNANEPLHVGRYDNAERWPFESPGHPGLSVFGDGRGCNTLTGSFEITRLDQDSNGIKDLSATFEQHCEGGPAVLDGTVDYTRT